MSPRNSTVALGLALIVILSGCSFGGESTPTPTEHRQSSLDGQLPAGVSANAVNDEALASAHVQHLKNGSVTVSHTRLTSNGKRETVVNVYGSRLHVTKKKNGRTVSELYATNRGAYSRVKSGDSVDYRTVTRPSFEGVSRGTFVRAVLKAGQFKPTNTEQQGNTTLTLITADTIDNATTLRGYMGLDTITGLSAKVTVGEDGFVRKMTAIVTGKLDGESVKVRHKVVYSNLGTTRVTEPNWVSEAKSDSVDVSAKLSENARAIFLIHEGGVTIPENSKLTVYTSSGETYQTTLEQPVTSGEIAYISFRGGDIDVSLNHPPKQRGDPIVGSYVVKVTRPNGDVLFEIPAVRG